jgi:DHA1 family bicyclomycin/chloramphenicol resistance-like MFS transporter
MSRRRLTSILGVLAALGPLSIDAALPAFPSMARSLGVSASAVQLTLAAYLTGIAAGQLLHGPLSDRLGRRPPLLAGLALYTLASVAGALAPTLLILWGARFAQGFGACAVVAVSRAVVRDRYAGRDAAAVYSGRMLVAGVAPILAPLLGGLIVATFGWRAVFVMLSVAGLGLTLLVAWTLPESLAPERARPGLGDALRGAATAFRDRRFVRMAIAGGASEAALFSCLSGASFVFIDRFGLSPERFGFVGAANGLAIVFASLVNRLIVRSFGVDRALRAGAGAALLSYAALVAAVRLEAGIGAVIIAMLAGVSSVGVVLPNATATAMDGRGKGAGSASAVLGLLQSGIDVLAAGTVSLLADGTPLPMALVMLGCGGIALALVLGAGPRDEEPARSGILTRSEPSSPLP